ncbi:suppressor of fused domain protein [Leifsonia shinshuensis]|uniref:suppressor of fused domain protein n=1 Tax=Leifsonia shinshuensis TaxID=150026 RepID=UPI001F511899|nr:suppressor of fused domain protein [Leifsonia shinshuensis]MCI0155110.1 suppressor of fused domain protein [Leifsonia shinshuensis]
MPPESDGQGRIARDRLRAALAGFDGAGAATARRLVEDSPAEQFPAALDVSSAELSTIYSRRRARLEAGSGAAVEVDTLLAALASDPQGHVAMVVLGSGTTAAAVFLSEDGDVVLAVLTGSRRSLLAAVDDHYRRHLGRLAGIRPFSTRPEGVELEFDLLVFEPGPDGYHPIATRGLSEHPLARSAGGSVRMELLMIVPVESSELAQSHLCDVTIDIVRTHRAPGRSEILERRGELFPGSGKVALLATTPVYQGGGAFFVLDAPGGRVLFPWLLPISATEADYARRHGAAAFEDVLEASEVDLRDPARASLV